MKDILIKCAEIIWDFSRLNNIPKRSEVMLVLGNDDPRSAEHAADLFIEGWADFVVISGKEGTGTRGKLPINKTEAEVFRDVMLSKGVPSEKIFVEMEATNTGENIQFTQCMLRKMGLEPKSVLAVTKSLVELRVALTFQKQWLGSEKVQLSVSSPPLTLLEYPSPQVGTLDQVVVSLIENFEKFTSYAKRGHQAHVEIPSHVQRAYRILEAHRNQLLD